MDQISLFEYDFFCFFFFYYCKIITLPISGLFTNVINFIQLLLFINHVNIYNNFLSTLTIKCKLPIPIKDKSTHG